MPNFFEGLMSILGTAAFGVGLVSAGVDLALDRDISGVAGVLMGGGSALVTIAAKAQADRQELEQSITGQANKSMSDWEVAGSVTVYSGNGPVREEDSEDALALILQKLNSMESRISDIETSFSKAQPTQEEPQGPEPLSLEQKAETLRITGGEETRVNEVLKQKVKQPETENLFVEEIDNP